jgi:hypothetical protein
VGLALGDPGIGYNACENLECLGPLVWSSKKHSQIIVLIYDLYSKYVIYLESIDFQVLLLCFSGIITVPGFFSGIITLLFRDCYCT